MSEKVKKKWALEMNRLRWKGVPKEERVRMARRMATAFWSKATPEQRKAIGRRLKKARKIAEKRRRKLSTG